MNKLYKFFQLAGVCTPLMFFSCSEDKGNYDYTEKQVITIEGIPENIAVLSGSDYLDFKPVVTSTIDGVIEGDNKDYTFSYQRKNSEGKWVDVEDTKDINQLATLSSGKHAFCFSVTDTKTGVKALQLFFVNSTTSTSEGWMVLCNEGADERARMDMLSQIDLDRIFPTHDVVRYDDEVPQLHHAKKIGFYSCQTNNRNKIGLLAGDGSYLLATADDKGYTEFITVTPINDLRKNLFVSQVDEQLVDFVPIPCAVPGKPEHDAVLCVTDAGNAYAWSTRAEFAGFELPINTGKRGSDPEYKVAPFVGATLARGVENTYGAALFYDIDNHRFIGWHGEDEASKQTCFPLVDPAAGDRKFSFNTKTMDLVSMVNTSFSNGVVYCIMQDGSKRHIYAINLQDDTFKQEGAYLDIKAPNFDKATLFSASSQYPVIYYAYKNEVYAYNYATQAAETVISLAAGEEVTMIKFDRVDHPWGAGHLANYDDVKTEIFQARENRLIVGSFDSSKGDNGGILRFYNADNSGMKLTLFKDQIKDGKDRIWEFDGYARIKDVKYKEVR